MMKMITLALLAAAGVQAAPTTSRRQMQDACADLTGDGVVAVADLLALLAGASVSKASHARASWHTDRPPAPLHRRAPACRCGVPGRWPTGPVFTHTAPNPSNLATKSSLTNTRATL
eukprot:COSAG06_NODE_34546_length_473_cov_0.695187_1_plen_116_part_10